MDHFRDFKFEGSKHSVNHQFRKIVKFGESTKSVNELMNSTNRQIRIIIIYDSNELKFNFK